MIEIKKRREPQQLITYRQQKFASYADMPKDVKEKVLNITENRIPLMRQFIRLTISFSSSP